MGRSAMYNVLFLRLAFCCCHYSPVLSVCCYSRVLNFVGREGGACDVERGWGDSGVIDARIAVTIYFGLERESKPGIQLV
jgi:hypothetical protein